MEKLEELLETFEKERLEKLKSDVWKNDTISPRIWSKSDITIYNKLQVISKEFGFIKWLVDNDKIDLLRLDNRIALSEFNKVERVLMALSIQDKPIEFLVNILK